MPKKYLTSRLIKLFSAIAIGIFLIFLNPKGILSPLKNTIFTLIYPFQKIIYFSGDKARETIDFLGSISDLKLENKKLSQENNYLISEVAKLKDAEKENNVLREQLSLVPREDYELESCFIIGQDLERAGSWIMVDKGKNKGLAEGMPVIVSKGILVGKILEVYATSAKVSLLSDVGSSVNALDLETGAKGLIKGEYGLGVIMDMVAQADVLNVGDIVVTSGLGNNMPRGLVIGSIQQTRVTNDKLFQQAIIMPKVKYSKLDVVFVVKNRKNQ